MLALEFVLLTLLMLLGVAAALVALLAPIGGMWPALLAAGIAVIGFAIWQIVRVNRKHIAQAKARRWCMNRPAASPVPTPRFSGPDGD